MTKYEQNYSFISITQMVPVAILWKRLIGAVFLYLTIWRSKRSPDDQIWAKMQVWSHMHTTKEVSGGPVYGLGSYCKNYMTGIVPWFLLRHMQWARNFKETMPDICHNCNLLCQKCGRHHVVALSMDFSFLFDDWSKYISDDWQPHLWISSCSSE